MLKGQRLFFRSEAPGLVFSMTYLRGKLAPSTVLPAPERREARASPTDKSRKDGGLPPVTTEKPLSLEPPSRGLSEVSRSAGGSSLVFVSMAQPT